MGGPDAGKPCVFPFKLNDVTFNECTTQGVEEKDKRPRCSTNVDEEGNHVGSYFGSPEHWGYCGNGCPYNEMGSGKNFDKCALP